MGKIKQVFKQLDNAARLKGCSNELSRAQETFSVHQLNLFILISNLFQVQAMGSTLSHLMQVKKDAKQQHEEFVALLKAHPELTDSERSAVRIH
jgi:hypothetical protein